MRKTLKVSLAFFLSFVMIFTLGLSSYSQIENGDRSNSPTSQEDVYGDEDSQSDIDVDDSNIGDVPLIDEDNPELEEEEQKGEQEGENPELVNPEIITGTLIINHLEKLKGEIDTEYELLEIEREAIEGLLVGSIIIPSEYTKEFEGKKALESGISELLIGEGDNELNLYYETIPTESNATLIVNHLVRLNDDEYVVLETENIEGLEIGSPIDPLKYRKEIESAIFLESDQLELILKEGDNELNLYYQLMDNINNQIGEAPDFPPGEGMEIESPYIEEFTPGELGPFPKLERQSRLSMFNFMSTATYPDEINNKTWPAPGSLKINKTGAPVPGTGNQFEIKLEIEGKNRIETSDIVLVMDRSGSMGNGGRMTNAKAAAVSFVNQLLNNPNNTTTRIALVSFAGDVTINKQFTGFSGKASLISAINGLNASGGTHIQAGIRQGISLLSASSAMNKSIVFLGDGGATYSYKPNNPNNYLEPWEGSKVRTTRNIPQSEFNYSSNGTVGDGSTENYCIDGYSWFFGWWPNSDRYYRHGAHAVAEAGFAPSDQNIYTIALGAGPEGEWTLNNMQNSGYYSTPDPTNLTAIYNEIAASISSAATNAVVTDPLGDMYDILGINGSNYNSLITVSHGSLSWDTTNEKITWNIGTISEGTVYWMKYKVALDYSAEGGVFYPANKPTYISYKNIDNADAKKYFPIPEFRLRELTISKTLTNGKSGDANKEFYITLEGPTGPYKKTWSVSLKPGESKTIKGLLPGAYTVKETVPMNFKLVGISPQPLVIGENDWKKSVNVTNKRSNNGWFWHDPDPKINKFTVGNNNPVTAKNSLPSEGKSLYGKTDYFVIPVTLEREDKFFQA